MTDVQTVTYADLLFPGAFFPQHCVKQVDRRDPSRVAREAMDNVFAFTFYDVMTTEVSGTPLSSDRTNESARYYIDAEKLTTHDVMMLDDVSTQSYKILLSNMAANGWDVIVRCRTGNFQPYEKDDRIVSSTTGEVSE